MQKQEILFPYGISNIEKAATEGYVLVDKTRFIERLERKPQAAFLRPRSTAQTTSATNGRTNTQRRPARMISSGSPTCTMERC